MAIPQEAIFRIFKNKQIIFCERTDSEYYNLALGNTNQVFFPARDSREVFLKTKNQPEYLGLRDRDFLKEEEIEKIKNKFPNFKILEYYCFENYLYHPENIEELKLEGFDKQDYIKEIIRQKEEEKMYIVGSVKKARQSYEEFKYDIEKSDDINFFIQSLSSNNLEDFYPFFSMKSKRNKGFF